VALAETLASWAAAFAVDRSKHHCIGAEINADHLRPASSGAVSGIARPIQLGTSLHVWRFASATTRTSRSASRA